MRLLVRSPWLYLKEERLMAAKIFTVLIGVFFFSIFSALATQEANEKDSECYIVESSGSGRNQWRAETLAR